MTFTYPLWIVIVLAAIAVAALVVGLVVYPGEKHPSRQSACFATTFILGFFIAPMILMERIVIEDGKFERKVGFWFAQKREGFPLDSVASIDITTRTNILERRNDYKEVVWVVNYKNGWRQYCRPSTLWDMHAGEIIDELGKHGIPVAWKSEESQ